MYPGIFLVRNKVYGQNLAYGQACVEIVNEGLQQTSFSSYEQAYDFFTEKIRNRASDLLPEKASLDKKYVYGKPRKQLSDPLNPSRSLDNIAALGTTFDAFHSKDFNFFETDLAQGSYDHRGDFPPTAFAGHQHVYITKDGIKIKLAEVIHSPNEKSVQYPYKNISAIKSALESLYKNTMDETANVADRKLAMIDLYFVMSQYCPLESGSATLARLMLQYTAEKIGIEIPLTKEGVNINTSALLTPHGIFVERFNTNYYFDLEVKPEEVSEWQKLVVAQRNQVKHSIIKS